MSEGVIARVCVAGRDVTLQRVVHGRVQATEGVKADHLLTACMEVVRQAERGVVMGKPVVGDGPAKMLGLTQERGAAAYDFLNTACRVVNALALLLFFSELTAHAAVVGSFLYQTGIPVVPSLSFALLAVWRSLAAASVARKFGWVLNTRGTGVFTWFFTAVTVAHMATDYQRLVAELAEHTRLVSEVSYRALAAQTPAGAAAVDAVLAQLASGTAAVEAAAGRAIEAARAFGDDPLVMRSVQLLRRFPAVSHAYNADDVNDRVYGPNPAEGARSVAAATRWAAERSLEGARAAAAATRWAAEQSLELLLRAPTISHAYDPAQGQPRGADPMGGVRGAVTDIRRAERWVSPYTVSHAYDAGDYRGTSIVPTMPTAVSEVLGREWPAPVEAAAYSVVVCIALVAVFAAHGRALAALRARRTATAAY